MTKATNKKAKRKKPPQAITTTNNSNADSKKIAHLSQTDILVLAENTQGKDIIIGDVHGAKSLLQKLIDEKLQNSHNRLFIVGDLIDRGADSLGVIQLIEQTNRQRRASGLMDQIYVVRGNHEEQFLAICEHESATTDSEKLLAHLKAIFFQNGGAWIEDLEPNQLEQVQTFFSVLPYIIHVTGTKPFHIVHADMPMNDAKLQARIQQGGRLSANEKKYVVWARENSPEIATNAKVVGRTPYAVPAFCGHTVVAEITENSSGRQRCEANIFNLDGLACWTGTFVTIELSKATGIECQNFEGDLPTEFYKPIAEDQQSKAKAALNTLPTLLQNNLKVAYENYEKAANSFEEYDAKGLDQYIRHSIGLSEVAAVDAKSKKHYIEVLRQIIDYLSAEKKHELAQYLIQHQSSHMLAKERHRFRWSSHSIQTRSMHIVLKLLGEIKQDNSKFFTQEAKQDTSTQEQTTYELTRHVKLLR